MKQKLVEMSGLYFQGKERNFLLRRQLIFDKC